jgi:hypothetical protein
LVNRLGTLVGYDALQIHGVTYGYVLGTDASAAQHIARVTGDIERHATVVPLGERHLHGRHGTGVFQAAQLQRQQLRRRNLARHVGQSNLYGLIRCQWTTKQLTRFSVPKYFSQTSLRCANDSPADAKARLRQARERCLQTNG